MLSYFLLLLTTNACLHFFLLLLRTFWPSLSSILWRKPCFLILLVHWYFLILFSLPGISVGVEVKTKLYCALYLVYGISHNSLALIIACLTFFWWLTESPEYFLGLILPNLVVNCLRNHADFQLIISNISGVSNGSFLVFLNIWSDNRVKWYMVCNLMNL